ncbi:N-6 DNA methylase [Flavobacterium sp.]|uniref:N-6 DNA methylase n=1 Tax=Flavobacterium sp. TaxID=239 RepID=UPI003F696395
MSLVQLYSTEKRKKNGVFYTPDFLSDYLSEKVIEYYSSNAKEISVLDPACGDSILLRSFAEKNIKNVTSKFIGIDIDINAINNSIIKFSKPILKDFEHTFINCDGLFPEPEKNSILGWNKLKNKLKIKNGFDIVLSNPPWGADLSNYNSQILSSNFKLTKGQFDIYNLFIEVILKNLNQNGTYALILPDSIFSQEQSSLRCLLSKNTTINFIARLGEKIFPEINRACVILIGKNKIPEKNHKVDCFRLSSIDKRKVITNKLSLLDIDKELTHKVLQTRFSENENFVFDIDLREDSRETFDKIEQGSIKLKTFVNNTRGAEISKKGIVWQCQKCKNWSPEPRSKEPKCKKCNTPFDSNILKEKIILNHNGIGNLKIKVGEDLYRYTSKSKNWINTQKKGINYKNLEIYEGKKILVRKTGIGITASIDYENSITNQVVYILKIKPKYESIITLEFILSVLNSRLMTYYLIKKYGENEWKSHPYLTQSMLVNLPIPNINFDCEKTLSKIKTITKLIDNEVVNSNKKNISRENDLFIEKTIADFFGLNISDYERIYESLHSADQLIPIKRLLECNIKEIFQ